MTVVAGVLLDHVHHDPPQAELTSMSSYRISVTPDHLVGRVQSATQFVAMASLPLAPILAGGLLALLGGPTAVLLAGVLCGLTAIIPTCARSIRAVPSRRTGRPRSRPRPRPFASSRTLLPPPDARSRP